MAPLDGADEIVWSAGLLEELVDRSGGFEDLAMVGLSREDDPPGAGPLAPDGVEELDAAHSGEAHVGDGDVYAG